MFYLGKVGTQVVEVLAPFDNNNDKLSEGLRFTHTYPSQGWVYNSAASFTVHNTGWDPGNGALHMNSNKSVRG
jgi:hypothetical protein